jgi:hypothetical protein
MREDISPPSPTQPLRELSASTHTSRTDLCTRSSARLTCGCGRLRLTGANQTYNVGVNFANRGEGSEVDMPTLAGCYAAACASALGVAYAGQRMVPKVQTHTHTHPHRCHGRFLDGSSTRTARTRTPLVAAPRV